MDDATGGQEPPARDHRFPGRQRPLRVDDAFALVEDRGTTRPVNRAVDPAATHQRRVGGVDDGIDPFARDVAAGQLEAALSEAPD
jgi:hypothetical protein